TCAERGRKQASCRPAGSTRGAMSGASRKNQTSWRVPSASRPPAAARPIGLSNVRTRVERPPLLARKTSSLFAWYVLTGSDGPSRCSNSTKLSVWVYRNSTAAGAAGEGLGVLCSPGFTGGTAMTADMRFLLPRRSTVVDNPAGPSTGIVVENLADTLETHDRRVRGAGQVDEERLVRLLLLVSLHRDRNALAGLPRHEDQR